MDQVPSYSDTGEIKLLSSTIATAAYEQMTAQFSPGFHVAQD
jgi:hypothetical protein